MMLRPVTSDCFTGTLNKVTLAIDRWKLTPEDVEKLKEAQRNKKASE